MLKVASGLSAIGSLRYQGTWDANANSPFLQSSVGSQGYYYVVSVAGTTNLNGITDWQVGDWAVYNGSAWQKIDNTDAVTSVNGYTGTVVLTYTDVGAAPATSGTSILYGNGSGGFSNASSGTDYAPATSGASILKGNNLGGFQNAQANVDYQQVINVTGLVKGSGSGVVAAAASGIDSPLHQSCVRLA